MPSFLPIIAFVLGTAVAAGGTRPAVAGTEPDEATFGGSLLVATTGGVTATFLGSEAGFFNTLYLVGFDDPIFDKDSKRYSELIFPSHLDAGTELIFRLDVRNTGDSFFTGDRLRNPDSRAHAKASTTYDEGSGTFVTTVGFEDLLGGGDNDYNDFMFQLTNVIDPLPELVSTPVSAPKPAVETAAAPAPSVLALLGLGIAGIAYRRRKQTKTDRGPFTV